MQTCKKAGRGENIQKPGLQCRGVCNEHTDVSLHAHSWRWDSGVSLVYMSRVSGLSSVYEVSGCESVKCNKGKRKATKEEKEQKEVRKEGIVTVML